MARALTQAENSQRAAFIQKKFDGGSSLTDVAWDLNISVSALSKSCARYGIEVPKGSVKRRRSVNLDAVERQQFRIPSDAYQAFDVLAAKRGLSVESLVVRMLIRLGKNPAVVDRLLERPDLIDKVLG